MANPFCGFNHRGGQRTRERIPASSVGIIIGKGGATIAKLQASSGARVRVLGERGGPEHSVEVTGEAEEVENCWRLVLKMLDGIGGGSDAARAGSSLVCAGSASTPARSALQ